MQRDGDYWPAITVAAGSDCNGNAAVTRLTTASFSQAANCSASMRYMRRDEGISWPSASAKAATRSSRAMAGGRLVVMTAPKLAADNGHFQMLF